MLLEKRERSISSCQRCGEPVDSRFRRLFGDDDDVAHGCTECYSMTAIKRGAASAPDRHGRIDEDVVAVYAHPPAGDLRRSVEVSR